MIVRSERTAVTKNPLFATKQQPFPPWCLFLAGLLLGTRSEITQWLRTYAEALLVSLYATGVTIYLLYSAYTRRRTNKFTQSAKRATKAVTTNTSSAPTTSIAATTEEDDALKTPSTTQQTQPPIDLTGTYQLISNQGFEEFLAVQGVPWALRRAANAARPIHRITQTAQQLTIQIQGIIESETTYIINGPPVETNVRGRIFEDVVEYMEDNHGIRVRKKALTEDYDVTVERVLSEDKQEIVLTSTAFFRDGRPSVSSVQLFRRV
ncbi:hypothetical protein FisN_19Lh028 [Fistulifera solaris]|uniref:Uncharacterized protein n=1 Tax=Fistulifera solaris TaxID=1519565 RepID=A0A1Z5JQZ5_FISSO|nr:hypothetical protein FisN_19Lh028 [Fistulifera solaris]|eukprot:GAX16450.1 hypothetical protein FisN_19Lh028 [Fistulifera solaris]